MYIYIYININDWYWYIYIYIYVYIYIYINQLKEICQLMTWNKPQGEKVDGQSPSSVSDTDTELTEIFENPLMWFWDFGKFNGSNGIDTYLGWLYTCGTVSS